MKRDDYPESRKEQEERERDTLPVVEPPAPYGPNREGPPTRTEIHRSPKKEENESKRRTNKRQ